MLNALKVAVIISATDKMSKVVNDAVNNSSKSLTRLSKEANKLGDSAFDVGRQAGMIGLAIGAPLFMLAKEAEAAATANARLEQVFVSMGDTTGKAAEKAKEFASALEFDIAVDGDDILAVQAKLATFENVIKNTAGTAEIFERATKAAFDLQAAGFGEGTQNAVQLGKALQDPIKGMTALSRSGVTFTAVEQEKIKAMVQSGKMLDAQRFLLAAVEKQVGGVAKATANDSDRMVIAFGAIKEALGTALLPTLKKLTDWMIKVAVPAVNNFVKQNGALIEKIMIGATAFAGLALTVSVFAFSFGAVMKVIAFGSTVFATVTTAVGLFSGGLAGATIAFRALDTAMKANIIILIASLIAAAAIAIYMNWDKIKKFFADLWENVKGVFQRFWNWAKNLFLNYTPYGLIIKHWEPITKFFGALWEKVKGVFKNWFSWLKLIFWDYSPPGLIYNHWDKIVGYFSNLWEKVKAKFMGFFSWFANLHLKFYKAGVNIVNSVWDGMKSKFSDMVKWFKSGLQDMRNMLPFSPAKTGPLKDIHRLKLVETIAQNIKPAPMVNAMSKAMGATKGVMTGGGGGKSPSLSVSGGGGSGVVVNFSPTINMSGASTGSKQDFIAQLKQYEPELMRVISQAMARKERTKFA
jgi:hypothetical protein